MICVGDSDWNRTNIDPIEGELEDELSLGETAVVPRDSPGPEVVENDLERVRVAVNKDHPILVPRSQVAGGQLREGVGTAGREGGEGGGEVAPTDIEPNQNGGGNGFKGELAEGGVRRGRSHAFCSNQDSYGAAAEGALAAWLEGDWRAGADRVAAVLAALGGSRSRAAGVMVALAGLVRTASR